MISPISNLNHFLNLLKFRWSSFSLYAIASIMSVSLRLKGLELRQEFFIASLGMGIVITLFTAILLAAGFRLFRTIRERAPISIIFMLLLAGGLRGAILHLEISGFGYENKISFWASVLSSTFYTAIYYSGASLFIELKNRRTNEFQAEFQRATLVRLGVDRFTSSSDSIHDYQSSMDAIKRAIQLHLPIGASHLPDTAQVSRVAAEIRDQIQMVIRPLSHRLWIGSMGELRIVNGSRILRDALQELSTPLWFTLLYQFSVGLFGIGISIGFVNGMAKTIPAIVGTYLCFQLLKFLRSIFAIPWQLRALLFLLALTFAPIALSEVFSSLIGIEVYWLAAVIIAPTLPVIVVISSLVLLVSRDRDFAIAAARSVSLQQLNSDSFSSDEISDIELSGYLHNSLQSELLRIAHRLDSAESTPAGVSADVLLIDLNKVLGRSLSDVRAIQSAGLDRIKALPEAWKGIADIELQIFFEASIQPDKERILAGCLEEIITNSIRYGEATKLHISLDFQNDVGIVISHNGSGSINAGTGLGAVWMAQIAQAPPTISKKHGLTQISFSI